MKTQEKGVYKKKIAPSGRPRDSLGIKKIFRTKSRQGNFWGSPWLTKSSGLIGT